MIDQADGRFLQLSLAPQQMHDITLARQQTERLPPETLCLVDWGYQGLVLENCTVVWPFKQSKRHPLEPEEQAFNQRLAQVRVKIEQRIRCLKVFRILKGVYRGRRQRLDLRLRLIAGLVNRLISTG